MSTYDISKAARITFKCREDNTSEEYQYSVATGARDPDVQDDILDRMEEFWTDELGGLTVKNHLVNITYAEWGTSGFTGFHQRLDHVVNLASNSGDQLPPQCAVVATFLNVSDPTISLKRRRGRMYLGLIGKTATGTDGKLTTTQRDALVLAMKALDDALKLTVPVSGNPDGICIASQAEGKLITADKVSVGLGVDTQRRRRKKITEGMVYSDLQP